MNKSLRTLFDFRKGEVGTVLLLFLFFFLVIAVFQILKPLSKGLFVEHYGAQVELYAKLANIGAAALGVVCFSYLYNRVSRLNLIFLLCGFFVASFVALTITLQAPGTVSIWGFYLLSDLESTLMVAAFWAFATDIASTDQAKRLFGVMGTGGVLGGWLGITSAKFLLNEIGMSGLLLLSGGLMVLVALAALGTEKMIGVSSTFGDERDSSRHGTPAKGGQQQSANAALEGARLVIGSRYLMAIVGIMAFYEMASQIMDYQFKLLTENLAGVVETQAFMIDVYFYANVVSVVVQLFLVSLIMRKFGLVTTLLVMPVAILLSSVAFLASPTLMVASLLVISDNGLNYSIQQTGRESLYVITTPDEKYKARAFTNMFVQRFAKGIGIFLTMGLSLTPIPIQYLSLFTVAVVILMILCSVFAGRHFMRKSPAAGPLPQPA